MLRTKKQTREHRNHRVREYIEQPIGKNVAFQRIMRICCRARQRQTLIAFEYQRVKDKPEARDPVARRSSARADKLETVLGQCLFRLFTGIHPCSPIHANLRQGHLTISNRVVSSSCPIWTRTCCDNETRVAQRSFPDDHHRFPGPCL
jgi:hypothetical protein